MPTPIGHTLSTLGLLEAKTKLKTGEILFLLAVGILPDIDLLLDKIPSLRRIGFYHQGITHTFLAALIFSLVILVLTRNFNLSFLTFLIYSLHIVLDLFMVDTKPPIGFSPLWPFYKGLMNFPFLPGVDKSSIKAILSFRTLKTLCWETSFFSYIYIIILGVKIWSGKKD